MAARGMHPRVKSEACDNFCACRLDDEITINRKNTHSMIIHTYSLNLNVDVGRDSRRLNGLDACANDKAGCHWGERWTHIMRGRACG